jgi:hypothetical protein
MFGVSSAGGVDGAVAGGVWASAVVAANAARSRVKRWAFLIGCELSLIVT